MRQEIISSFIQEYIGLEATDKELRPEQKFSEIEGRFKFSPLPFGYGRARPIDYNKPIFYIQQLSDEEVKNMRRCNETS
jgi:hypothetical protein